MIQDQYLNLLSNVLTFSLWPEPARPVSIAYRNDWKARIAKLIDRMVAPFGVRLYVEVSGHVNTENGTGWPIYAHTMVGRKRLKNIQDLCTQVVRGSIEGNFVECGVWRGGASMFARACLPMDRTVFCCDSFDGFPEDSREPDCRSVEFVRVNQETVEANFRRFGLREGVQFIKGFFSDTLPTLECGSISILRADGDMYSSTLDILNNLYRKVSHGGFVIIDDYFTCPNCKAAVQEFLASNSLVVDLVPIDEHAVYWRK